MVRLLQNGPVSVDKLPGEGLTKGGVEPGGDAPKLASRVTGELG